MRFIEGVVGLLSSCVIPALVVVCLDHACFQRWASVWDQCSSKRREANFQQQVEIEFRLLAKTETSEGNPGVNTLAPLSPACVRQTKTGALNGGVVRQAN